ncbi:protein ATP6V1FNB [Microcaecilia unicolor]|uniref:Protein ATP6V1FNB n=1 Tax=Microcaecilia unicolor TaxID=1415580 RepID=A0A6P7YJ93_9AMPH|nr:protein ATP6V1FNB [Microcaecilia unicolor]
MRDLLNTRTQNCWRELLQKEMRTRLAWKIKYGKDYPGVGVPAGGGERKRREAPALVKRGLPEIGTPRTQTPEEKVDAQTQTQSREPSAKPKEFNIDMRPPSPQTLKFLYQGLSNDGSGRQQYLQRRKLKGPEEKFPYPLITSWDYGWHIGEAMKDFKSPSYGRSAIVKDTFYKKNGISWESSRTDRLL